MRYRTEDKILRSELNVKVHVKGEVDYRKTSPISDAKSSGIFIKKI